MRIVVAGGTGFLGRPLGRALEADGHSIVALTRSSATGRGLVSWQPDGTAGEWAQHLDRIDGVINLAGESIGGGRWTHARKDRIRDSRVLATRSIVAAMERVAHPPRFLINASGIGYYGSRADEVLTEESGPGSDFLASVCQEWEAEALKGEGAAGARVVLLRSGVVFGQGGGVLQQMALPFKFFVGGRLGSGRQYLSWIHREDWIALVRFLVLAEDARGAFNVTSPTPSPNAEFTDVLASALHRPAWIPAPAFALRAALGEMADGLLLPSQRAVPAHALAMGFTFAYPTLTEALGEIVRK